MSVTISTVNVGSAANDGTGDDIRDAFIKVNYSLGNLKTYTDGLLSSSASLTVSNVNTQRLTLTSGSLASHNLIGNVYLTGADTVYINGSPVATSAVNFAGGTVPGAAAFTDGTASNGSAYGAVTITGGVGVGGNIYAGGVGVFAGNLVAASTTDASSTTNAALISVGGLGVAKSAFIGQALNVSGATLLSSTLGVTGITNITNSTVSTNTTTGALKVAGGAGIVGNINAGGTQHTLSGNLTVTGNLAVNGNLTFGTDSLRISDGIIDLHTDSANSPLTIDDGKDVGIRFHVYKPGYGDYSAFVGWANDTGYLEYYDRGVETGNVFTGNTYGTIKSGGYLSVNTTAATSTTTGAILTSGGMGVAGNIYAGGNVVVTNNITASGNVVVTNNITASGTANLGNVITTGGVFWANGTAYSSGGGGSVAASSLTGTTLASGVTASSLTTVGNLTVLTMSGNIVPSANLIYNLGSTTAWWSTVYGKSVQSQYADLAENYASDSHYRSGTVVVFGGSAEITLTTEFADVAVAGVISTNPAYLMNAANAGQPVALRGRVPVDVIGPVSKGDLLVTSASPGYAASVGKNANYGVAVFAKALQDKSDDGAGTIEAVII